MKTEKTTLPRVILIELDSFKDHRGEYVEIYNEELYKENGIDVKFVQDDISISRKHVLRGIYGDEKTWKLISCFYGEIFLAVVNRKIGTKEFGAAQTFTLSEQNRFQILVPNRYGIRHVVLSESAIFHYKQTTIYRGPEYQFTYRWDEPEFSIDWPIKEPALSHRDATASYITESGFALILNGKSPRVSFGRAIKYPIRYMANGGYI